MRSRPLLVLASCLGSLTVYASTSQAKPKVAVLGLEVTGDSAMDPKATEAAKALTRELRREAGRPDGLFELAPNSSKDLLEMKLLSDCGDEGKRCMSEIGKQLKSERLVYGKLERTRRGYAASLRLLDTESSQILKELSEVIPYADVSAAGGLQQRSRRLYAGLTGADAEGSLSIRANAERGTVYIDGQIRTTLSAGSARVSGLTPGVHVVGIESPGLERFEAEVDINPGETRNLDAKLVELEGDEVAEDGERPGGGWRVAFWSGVIATGAAGGGFTFVGLSARSRQDDLNEAKRNAAPLPGAMPKQEINYCENDFYKNDQAIQDGCETKKLALWANVLAGTTAAAAIFSAFAYYKGYMAPRSSAEREARRRHRSGMRVTVTPALGPNLVGAGLELQF